MTRMSDFIHQQAAEPSQILKIANLFVAGLGVSSFLGLVHLLVGVFSVCWLALQGYGYVKYELPLKREKLKRMRAGLVVNTTQPGDLT